MLPWGPGRIQRPLLHAGYSAGTKPQGARREEGEEVQFSKEKGQAGEAPECQRGAGSHVHPGHGGQTGDAQSRVEPAFCVVSTV